MENNAGQDLSHGRDATEQGSITKTGSDDSDGRDDQRSTQSGRLVQLVASAELFHTAEQEAFATISVGSHQETHAVRDRSFYHWLAGQYYSAEGRPPGSQPMRDALAVIEAKAVYEGPTFPLFVRLGNDPYGNIHLDLGDENHTTIEINKTDWGMRDSPIRFRRSPGIESLPCPAPGSIDQLRPFINVADETDFRLLVGWLVGAFQPRGPYPPLVQIGQQGSGKTTQSLVLQSLIDPSTPSVRGRIRDERDLMIAARNNWLLALDNQTHLPPWLSDSFCRLSTGGGFSTRALHTDRDEVRFNAQRPIILNGISDMVSRDDLRDRAIILTLPRIKEWRTEREFWAEFERARPNILGALLTAVSAALKNLESGPPSVDVRMADFATWVTAAERGLGWEPGTYLSAYRRNRESAVQSFVEDDSFASAIRALVHTGNWKGSASKLLADLKERGLNDVHEPKNLPNSPRGVRAALDQVAPALRMVGVEVSYRQRTGNERPIEISRTENGTRAPSCPSHGDFHAERAPQCP